MDDMHTDAVADLASVDPLIPETPIGDPLDADRYEEASIVPIVGGRALEDIRAELVRLREETIYVEMPGADRTRGLLRKAMLDIFCDTYRQIPTSFVDGYPRPCVRRRIHSNICSTPGGYSTFSPRSLNQSLLYPKPTHRGNLHRTGGNIQLLPAAGPR